MQQQNIGMRRIHPGLLSPFRAFMEQQKKSPGTIQRYMECVADFALFSNQVLKKHFYEEITPQDIISYIDFAKNKTIEGENLPLSDSTRAGKWSALNLFFAYLVNERVISSNPVMHTARPQRAEKNEPPRLTTQEIISIFGQILEKAVVPYTNRDALLISLLLLAESSISDILNIDLEHLDFQENTVLVSTKKIFLPPILVNLIKNWLEDRERYFSGDAASGPLFLSQKRLRLSPDAAQGAVTKYTNHLPQRVTTHTLRIASASRIFDADIQPLSEIILSGKKLSLSETSDKNIPAQDIWQSISLVLKETLHPAYRTFLFHPEFTRRVIGEDTIYVIATNLFTIQRLNNPRVINCIVEAAKAVTGRTFAVQFAVTVPVKTFPTTEQ